MPLKCHRDNQFLVAFDFESDEALEALRQENAQEKNLRMPCCGASVTLRTSKLGTKHFAHARRGPCATAPEWAEHLLAKRTIIKGVRRTDSAAVVEHAGDLQNAEPGSLTFWPRRSIAEWPSRLSGAGAVHLSTFPLLCGWKNVLRVARAPVTLNLSSICWS